MKAPLLLAVGLLLVVGCLGASDEKSAKSEPTKSVESATVERKASEPVVARRYSRREVRWLKRIARWEERYFAAVGKGEDAYYDVLRGTKKLPYLRRSLRPMQRCAPGLRARVGAPPTKRLEPSFELLVDACRQQRRLARATLRAFVESEDLTEVRAGAEQETERLLKRARRMMDRFLMANRALPVAGGMTKKSRIEPRFTRAASRIALKRVQVRCWSPGGWKTMIKEWEAYTGTRVEVAGFANGAARAYMAPKYCADLARFTYRRWRPASGEELLDAAYAVNVLAHESHHLLDPRASEAEVECRSLQDLRRTARWLGARAATGSPRSGVLVEDLSLTSRPSTGPRTAKTAACSTPIPRPASGRSIAGMHRVTLERGRDGGVSGLGRRPAGVRVSEPSRDRRYSRRSRRAISEFVAWTGHPGA